MIYIHLSVLTLSCIEWEALSYVQWQEEIFLQSCNLLEVPVLEQLPITTFSGKYSIGMYREDGLWQASYI